MKEIPVKAVFRNPYKPELRFKAVCLIDTGATICVLPRAIAEVLKLQTHGIMEVRYANGNVEEVPTAFVWVEVFGKRVYIQMCIVGGPKNPLLGMDLLQLLDIHIDTRAGKALKPVAFVEAVSGVFSNSVAEFLRKIRARNQIPGDGKAEKRRG